MFRERAPLVLLWLWVIGCGGSATVQQGAREVDPVGPPATAAAEGAQPLGGRLPRDVRPLRYALDLAVDPRQSHFEGSATIDVDLAEPRSVIWLHASGLEVSEASFEPLLPSGDFGPAVAGSMTVADEEDGFASLALEEPVRGRGRLRFAYRAPFGAALGGIYKVEHAGESYAFTQMEPLSARTAFPSFDEPGFKTPFELTLRVAHEHLAAANSPVASRSAGEASGVDVVRFEPTPPIPTYLFALAVGPLEVVEGEPIAANGVRATPLPFRGLAPKGRGAELAYTMANTPAILAQLEAYFGIPYPYAKLDLVAVPDFEAGAMENVGLVTFRDTILLVDEARTPTDRMRFWAYIVAHELAHMWFGNLVTMEWWDDLWLNEAFASWIEHRIVAAWRPACEADVELFEWVSGVMDSDSLSSARAIRQPIASSHDIHNAFDGITYGKGAGVLAMFERSLGEEAFRDGIRAYLRAHREGNATARDLFAALGESAGRDVQSAFDTFVGQSGVPLLSAELSCDEGAATVKLTQSRFLPVASPASRERAWQVPVCIRHGGGPRGDQLATTCGALTGETGEIALDTCPDWIHPNADGIGYYRWSLDDAGLAALRQRGLRHLSTTEKLSLVDSLQAAFAADRAEPGPVVDAFLSLAGDAHHAVATAPMGFYADLLEQHLEGASAEGLRARLRRAYGAQGRRLGWAPRAGRTETQAVRLRRAAVIGLLANDARDAQIRREGERRGRAYVQWGAADASVDREAVPADLAVDALVVAVQEGDAAFFEHVEGVLSRTEDGLLRGNLLRGLGSTRDPELGARALSLALDPDLRVNEVLVPVARQLAEPTTRPAAWTWLQANFDALVARLPPSYAGYLPRLMEGSCDTEVASAVDAFFAERVEALPGGPRNAAGATESIRLCVALDEAQGGDLRAWLAR